MTAVRGDDERSLAIPGASLPALKSWGRQTVLRCLTVDGSDGEYRSAGRSPIAAPSRAPGDPSALTPPRKRRMGGDGALEAVRAKLMCHLREAADRVPLPAGVSGAATAAVVTAAASAGAVDRDVERVEPPAPVAEKAAGARRPWNLRARTAVRRVVRFGFEAETDECASLPPKSPCGAERVRPPFALTLTSREITEDVFAVTGSLPRRRPAKRPRVVQRQLDVLLPGSCLTEITLDSYRVPL